MGVRWQPVRVQRQYPHLVIVCQANLVGWVNYLALAIAARCWQEKNVPCPNVGHHYLYRRMKDGALTISVHVYC
jgi:hypothetical protein